MSKPQPKSNANAAMSPPNQQLPGLMFVVCVLTLVLGVWIALRGPGNSQNYPPIDSVNVLLQVLRICIESALILGPWWLGAAGLGWLIRRGIFGAEVSSSTMQTQRNIWQNFMTQLAMGATAMLLSAWLLAWAGALNSATSWLLCLAGIAVGFWRLIRWHRALPGGAINMPAVPWPIALAMPAIGLLIAAACIPPGLLWAVEAFGYDVMSYHLQLPRQWMELGAMRPLQHNVYSFLPSLVEAGYLHLSWMKGSVYTAVYTCQLFHVSMAVMAAAMLATLLTRFVRVNVALLVGAMLLFVPWVTITGSCAYDEMFSFFFAAAALSLVCDEKYFGWRLGSAVGLLLAGMTLAKLTSGAMLAVPMGLLLVLRPLWLRGELCASWKKAFEAAFVAALVGSLLLGPYFARNAIASGNPVFPFLTRQLGHGHWNAQLMERWNKGHAGEGSLSERLTELKKQGWSNTGYGAIGGAARVRGEARFESRNVARFDAEQGVSPLWIAMIAGALLGLACKKTRRLTLAMLGLMFFELVVWTLATHLQSRFLLPTLLPGLVLLGVGFESLVNIKQVEMKPVMGLGAVLLCILALVDVTTFWQQTMRLPNEKTHEMESLPPWLVIDALPSEQRLDLLELGDAMAGDHILNHLVGANQKVLLVADVARLLYIRRPMVYNSAFDPNPLGEIFREKQGDSLAITQALRQRGITHLWVHWSELERLSGSYGFDSDITAAGILKMAREGHWKDVYSVSDVATCYEIP